MKIGNPSSSSATGTTARANVMALASPFATGSGARRAAPRTARRRDDEDQSEAERHHAMRDPHRHARHVADAADPQHLPGVEIGLRQHEAGENDEQQLLGDPQQHGTGAGMNRTRTSIRRCWLRRVTTAAPRNVIADHDEDLHFVGAQQRDAEQVAADHVGEVEQDRHDEKQCQHELDDACDPIEDLNNHPSPHLPRWRPAADDSERDDCARRLDCGTAPGRRQERRSCRRCRTA